MNPRLFAPLLAVCALSLASATDVQVGVYRGPGSSDEDAAALRAALEESEGLSVRDVSGRDLAQELEGLQVLVIGGGGGTSLGEGLGAQGGAAIQDFVRRGGGYLGLGAGAYLGARGYNAGTRNLELVDARLVDRSGWKARGDGQVELQVLATPFGALPAQGWAFSQGPLFTQGRGHDWAPYLCCARFVTDLMPDDKERAGVMPGTDAVVCARYGAGRAALFSVLPHRAAATHAALQQAVRWAAGQGEAPAAEVPQPPEGALRVALLDDDGAIEGCVQAGLACLDADPRGRFWARRVSAAQVRAGVLDDYQLLIASGGSATKQSRALETQGQDAVRAFVDQGGGYVGICAGAYLGASEPKRYGLGLAPVRCMDTAHWKRGHDQVVELEALPAFARLAPGVTGDTKMLYANGPLLQALDDAGDGLQPLLIFRSDVHEGDAPAGMMPGKLAALTARYGKGRVALFSTHPELTRAHNGTLVRAAAWATGASALD